jgi:hypothetical protein
MKKHLLALATGLLLGGAVPQIATAQVANPAKNPERYVFNNIGGCDSTFWDVVVQAEYKVPPELQFPGNLEKPKVSFVQGMIAKGWFCVRFTEYPFVTTLSNDTAYHYTDISEGQVELRAALAQLQERFGNYIITTSIRANQEPCVIRRPGYMRGIPSLSSDLPYFFIRFEKYVSVDSVYKYLWHLPKTERWGNFGDFASDARMDSVENRLTNILGWRPLDHHLYFPYQKAAGFIYAGAIPTSVVDNIFISQPSLICYPNPAFTQMEIRLFKNEAGVIDIVNAEGAVMQRYSVDGATTLQADVSALPTGVYFVRYGSFSQKILIAR